MSDDWVELWIPVMLLSVAVMGVGFGTGITAAETDHGHLVVALVEMLIGAIGFWASWTVIGREEKK